MQISSRMAQRTYSYALPQFVIALSTLALVNFAPSFYATEAGVSLGTLSLLLLVSRFSDVVTDPVIGWISDRTRTRWGRRKPIMAVGVPIFMGSVWMLFHPTEDAGALYFVVWYSMVFFGLTLIQLPYSAWGAEMTRDYNQRTRIFSRRELVGSLGSITGIGVIIALALTGETRLGPALHIIVVLLCIAAPVMIGLSFLTPARLYAPTPDSRKPVRQSIFHNRSFIILLLALVSVYMGITPGGAMVYFLFDDLLARPDLFGLNLLAQFVAGGIGVGLWSRLAQRIPKGRAVAWVLIWFAGFTALMPLAAAQFGVWGVIGIATVRSLALGATLALPYSVFADVVDVDTLATGRERTGQHIAVAGLTIKLAITAGVSLSFAIPSWFGFEPGAPANTELAEFSVKAVWSFLPGLLWLPAILLFWNFPIGPEDAARTRAALEARRA